VRQVDAGGLLEELADHVVTRPAAGRAVIERARVRLGKGDHLLQRLEAVLGMEDDHVRHRGQDGHRGEIALEAVRQLRIERLGDGVMDRADEPGVPVGRFLRRPRRAEGAARAAHVLDQHLLTEELRHLRGPGSREGVRPAAGGERVDRPDRLDRPGLRRGPGGRDGDCECGDCER
jgi:hypothetical protein